MKNQHGFSLLEAVITLSIITAISVFIMSNLGPWLSFKRNLDTEARLKEVQEAMAAAYRDNALTIDNATGAVLTLASGDLQPALPNGAGACQSSATTLLPVSRYSKSSAANLIIDGGAAQMCVYITQRLSQSVGGNTLYFHKAAIVSPGNNGVIDSGTTLDASGNLTLAGDDKGAVLDGYTIQYENYRSTVVRMERVIASLQAYFSTRYSSDPARDVSVDYFANTAPDGSVSSRWDAGGSVQTTSGTVAPLTDFITVLGLSPTDITDGYGQTMLLDNSSADVRQPNNATTSMTTPPYTAIVKTTLPGNFPLTLTAVGTF